jgi:hypothetical protein
MSGARKASQIAGVCIAVNSAGARRTTAAIAMAAAVGQPQRRRRSTEDGLRRSVTPG